MKFKLAFGSLALVFGFFAAADSFAQSANPLLLAEFPAAARAHAPAFALDSSSSVPFWFPWVIGGAVAIALIFIARSGSKKRAKAVESAAISMGFTYEGDGKNLVAQIGKAPIRLFSMGHSKVITNVLRGSDGITIFDYQYTTGSGRYSNTQYQTVAAFTYPAASIPTFQFGPEHWYHKVGNVVGFQLIRFDSHPSFTKRFLLRGPDESAIRSFFMPPLLSYFESLPEKPSWCIEATGPLLLVYVHSHRAKPEMLRNFATDTSAIAAQIAANAGMRLTHA